MKAKQQCNNLLSCAFRQYDPCGTSLSSRSALKSYDQLSVHIPHPPSFPMCLQCPLSTCTFIAPAPSSRNNSVLYKLLWTLHMAKVSGFPGHNSAHEPVFSNVHVPQYVSIFHFPVLQRQQTKKVRTAVASGQFVLCCKDHTEISIRAPVSTHRSHKEDLSSVLKLHSTGKDPNVCRLE